MIVNLKIFFTRPPPTHLANLTPLSNNTKHAENSNRVHQQGSGVETKLFLISVSTGSLLFPLHFTLQYRNRTTSNNKICHNCTYKYFSHLMQYVRLSQNYLLIYLHHCNRTSIVTILDMDRAGWWQSAATPIGACSARSHTVYDDLTAMSVIGQSIAYHNWIACRLYMRRQSDTFAAFAWMTNKHAMWTNRQTATFLLQTVTICSHWPGQRNNYKQVY